MGYSYGRDGRTGRMLLACDSCGNIGGVRRRQCPVGYCSTPALCAACNTKHRQNGDWATWHADCPRLHAEYAAEQAAKAANPDQWARAAWGDWQEGVPQGMVKVLTHAGTEVYVPEAQYNPSVAGFGA